MHVQQVHKQWNYQNIYCYLERDNDEVLKFQMNNFSD